jgi:peptidoglycan L-alanyl-D-glutamate endopeptidase CwlK
MNFKLGKRSIQKLSTVDERLQRIVRGAITVTEQDFSVICGIRTIQQQKALVKKGASQTMKSKHIDGLAVDLMAYSGGGRWELNLYDEIADSMKASAKSEGYKIRWGAAWTIDDIGAWKGTTHTYYSKTTQAERNVEYSGSAEDAMNYYIDLRRDQGRRPFIDAPHFELIV